VRQKPAQTVFSVAFHWN